LRMPAVLGAVVFALSWRGSGRRRSFADFLPLSPLFPEECPAFFDDEVLFCAEAADLDVVFSVFFFRSSPLRRATSAFCPAATATDGTPKAKNSKKTSNERKK
jgi:hypothetical protein